MTRLHHHRADEGRVELQAEAQIRPFRRRLEDLAYDGQLHGGEQVMARVIAVAAVPQQHLLAPLRNHAEGRPGDSVERLRRGGGAVEVEPLQWLNRAFLRDGPCNALRELLPVGVLPVRSTL